MTIKKITGIGIVGFINLLLVLILSPVLFKTKNVDIEKSSLPPIEVKAENTPPIASVSATPNAQSEFLKVTKIIDGDTIVLSNDETLRYIGIDTPETKHPSKPQECYGKEASNKNKELVLNKEVRLEKDISETDRYNRLLRYVFVGEEMVNEVLVKEGYAKASSYPPDIKYQERFNEAEKYARDNRLGLWGDACEKTIESTTIQKTITTPDPFIPQTTHTPSPVQNASDYNCDCNKSCSKISSCTEAYFQLNECGCSKRDGDDDGIPCEKLCN